MNPSKKLLAIALALVAPIAGAQVAIDQAAALAGGVTPGDTAGFPVTLSVPGSYKLTGNLMIGTGGRTGVAVHITAPNVSLNLNGFTIGGDNRCDTVNVNLPGNTCTATPTDPLVRVEAPFARIHNGIVEGSYGDGIFVATPPPARGGSTIEDLQIVNNLGYGISSADDGTNVRNVLSTFNRLGGVLLANESTLENVRTSRNNGNGIQTGSHTVASQILGTYNTGFGVYVDGGSITRMEASMNGADGYYGSAAISFSRANSNTGTGFRNAVMLTQSSASFNGAYGYAAPATGGCYANLHANANTTGAISAGTGFVGTLAVCP